MFGFCLVFNVVDIVPFVTKKVFLGCLFHCGTETIQNDWMPFIKRGQNDMGCLWQVTDRENYLTSEW